MSDRPGSVVLGINVRALRRGRGLTQDELGEKAGITKSYVSRIEKGKRPVNPELLDKLAGALDVDVAALDESTVLETRSTVWRLEHLVEGEWKQLWPEGEFAEPDPVGAQENLQRQREGWGKYEWRAVRVETIETVEVW